MVSHQPRQLSERYNVLYLPLRRMAGEEVYHPAVHPFYATTLL